MIFINNIFIKFYYFDDDIFTLKNKIREQILGIKFNVNNIILLYNNKILENGKYLKDYNIKIFYHIVMILKPHEYISSKILLNPPYARRTIGINVILHEYAILIQYNIIRKDYKLRIYYFKEKHQDEEYNLTTLNGIEKLLKYEIKHLKFWIRLMHTDTWMTDFGYLAGEELFLFKFYDSLNKKFKEIKDIDKINFPVNI